LCEGGHDTSGRPPGAAGCDLQGSTVGFVAKRTLGARASPG